MHTQRFAQNAGVPTVSWFYSYVVWPSCKISLCSNSPNPQTHSYVLLYTYEDPPWKTHLWSFLDLTLKTKYLKKCQPLKWSHFPKMSPTQILKSPKGPLKDSLRRTLTYTHANTNSILDYHKWQRMCLSYFWLQTSSYLKCTWICHTSARKKPAIKTKLQASVEWVYET